MNERTPSRRGFLRASSGVLAGLSIAGVVSGGSAAQPVRVNVGYATDAARRAAIDAAFAVRHEFSFDVVTITTGEREAERLADRDGIDYVEPDAVLRTPVAPGRDDPELPESPGPPATPGVADTPGPPDAPDGPEPPEPPDVFDTPDDLPDGTAVEQYPWGVDRVDADVVHEAGRTSGGEVAVVDTGIDLTHPDLFDNVGEGIVVQAGVSTADVVGPREGVGQDDNGHGTHVAGIAGAVGAVSPAGVHYGIAGVAPDVTLHPVKVLNASGYGLTSDVAKGLEEADEHWGGVANLSLTGPETRTLRDAMDEVGLTTVAAAGNTAQSSAEFPASAADYAVRATTIADTMAAYSSGGDIAAPGDNVPSTYPGGYAVLSGTSMAAPHVAGSIALTGRAATGDAIDGVGLLDVARSAGLRSGDDLGGPLDALDP